MVLQRQVLLIFDSFDGYCRSLRGFVPSLCPVGVVLPTHYLIVDFLDLLNFHILAAPVPIGFCYVLFSNDLTLLTLHLFVFGSSLSYSIGIVLASTCTLKFDTMR
jgi:hypothetical protein